MNLKKTLISLVLTGALAGGIAGCGENRDYLQYDGEIGEDHVSFTTSGYYIGYPENTLKVIKPDGRVIRYLDKVGNDLKLESVEITEKETNKYTADEIGKPILEEAQKQFDLCLQKIKEKKLKEGLEGLR
jgi:hypothetical protein